MVRVQVVSLDVDLDVLVGVGLWGLDGDDVALVELGGAEDFGVVAVDVDVFVDVLFVFVSGVEASAW